jgi:hypothetical protein
MRDSDWMMCLSSEQETDPRRVAVLARMMPSPAAWIKSEVSLAHDCWMRKRYHLAAAVVLRKASSSACTIHPECPAEACEPPKLASPTPPYLRAHYSSAKLLYDGSIEERRAWARNGVVRWRSAALFARTACAGKPFGVVDAKEGSASGALAELPGGLRARALRLGLFSDS